MPILRVWSIARFLWPAPCYQLFVITITIDTHCSSLNSLVHNCFPILLLNTTRRRYLAPGACIREPAPASSDRTAACSPSPCRTSDPVHRWSWIPSCTWSISGTGSPVLTHLNLQWYNRINATVDKFHNVLKLL